MEKKIGNIGFVLGKFYPLHNGHIHLIKTASQLVNKLIVMIGSLKSETIPGELRYEWLKETFPNLEIIHLTDENPQYPEEHPDFWNIWTSSIRKHIPDQIDYIFSSEEYGEKLAEFLQSKHICIDLNRKIVPISGTSIRENPIANWDFISNAAKPYFVKRIVLYGPESTGKTTLSRKLAEYFKTEWIPEYAREYLEAKPTPVEFSDIPLIAKGQIRIEEEAAKKANKILFCDTDVLVTKVYSEHYYNKCPDWISESAYNRKYALHLLTNIDIPWVADKLRDRGDRKEEMFNLFKQELEKSKRPFKFIYGNYEERFNMAVEIIKRNILKEDNERKD